MCIEIRFNAVPAQKSKPKINAINPARLSTMDVIRISMTAIFPSGTEL
jgi:hypothetical protein